MCSGGSPDWRHQAENLTGKRWQGSTLTEPLDQKKRKSESLETRQNVKEGDERPSKIRKWPRHSLHVSSSDKQNECYCRFLFRSAIMLHASLSSKPSYGWYQVKMCLWVDYKVKKKGTRKCTEQLSDPSSHSGIVE